MSGDPGLEPQRIHITLRPGYGTFSEREREAIVKAVQRSGLGEVRIDEAIEFNLGLGGGPGGLPITFDVWLAIGEGVASGLLTLAITKAIAPIVKIIRHRIARLVVIVRRDTAEPVRYVVNPTEELPALDALPADYEVTIRTESRIRIWKNGRWERYESSTAEEREGGWS
jgi:hypothetical protein